MPVSRHRRHGRNRPREYQTHEPEKKPAPSPTWVPATGAGLLVAGVIVIILGNLPGISRIMRDWIWLGGNWSLVGGFLLLMVGFGFLTRWR